MPEENTAHSEQRDLDKRLFALTSLFEISRSLSASLNLHAILENVLRIPMGQMLIKRGLVLLKMEHDIYQIVEVKGLPRHLVEQTVQIEHEIIHPSEISTLAHQDLWIPFMQKIGIELLLPLNSTQGNIGYLCFGSKINNDAYTEDEVEFLDTLSNIAATSVTNGQMVEEIQQINRGLDRKVQQLNTIFDISREFTTTEDPGKIGSILGFAVMGELLVNKYAIFLKDSKDSLPLASKGVGEIKRDETFFLLSEPMLLSDTGQFPKLQHAGLSLIVPMRMQEETRGIFTIGERISKSEFQQADIEFLTILGNQAISAIENARHFQTVLEKQRMEEELNLARQIQKGLLPTQIPGIKGYDVDAVNIPSREVGGDYFDIIPIRENTWGIAIGDVAGKGAGAALLMASLQASLRALAVQDLPVEKMIAEVNRLIYQSTDMDKFVTFFYGVLDLNTHQFTFCNAGHNYPLFLKADQDIQELHCGGLVLGMMPRVEYKTDVIQFDSGDQIFLYTDGLTEAMNEEKVEYGEERVKEFIRTNRLLSSEEIIQTIFDDVKAFSGQDTQSDDITMVVLKRMFEKNN